VLYDGHRQTMRFLYFVDKLDPWVNDPGEEMPVTEEENTLTMHLVRSGEALRGPSLELRERHGIPHNEASGPDSADWLGVPMCRDEQVVGAIVVQNYERPDLYTEDDRILLAYVAQHILTAIDRHEARGQLERRGEERTAELRQAHLALPVGVAERQGARAPQRPPLRAARTARTCRSRWRSGSARRSCSARCSGSPSCR